MSSRCQCPFSGPSDTILGCHRDPISSEKGWLDFAVRELSRVAAGKARGQEAVWRSQCKPNWWDSVCPHPWKNPTANPKDSKDTLKVKFECLVQHLRKVGQLPREMEEEIHLWEKDQKPEVFLMTTFSSLLGQASNLHSLVDDTCHKMEESGISVDNSILNDLQSCLTACVRKLNTIQDKAAKRNQPEDTPKAAHGAGSKRRSCERDSDSHSHPASKRFKRSSLSSPSVSGSSTSPAPSLVQSSPSSQPSPPRPTLTPSPQVSDTVATDDPSKILLAALQKQLLLKQEAKTAETRSLVCQIPNTENHLKPVAFPSLPNRPEGGKKRRVHGMGPNTVAKVTSLGVPSSVCLSATAPYQSPVPDFADSADIVDFLELDLEGQDGVADCQVLNDFPFVDSLLREALSEVSVNVDSTPPSVTPCLVTPSSVTPAVLSQSSPSTQLSVSQVDLSNHDPFLGLSLSSKESESSLFEFDVSRQTEMEMAEECIGTALCSGVGDMGGEMQDTEVVSESGYNSESSMATSHRGSLDSETSEVCSYPESDLSSPDLEAYLDSLDV